MPDLRSSQDYPHQSESSILTYGRNLSAFHATNPLYTRPLLSGCSPKRVRLQYNHQWSTSRTQAFGQVIPKSASVHLLLILVLNSRGSIPACVALLIQLSVILIDLSIFIYELLCSLLEFAFAPHLVECRKQIPMNIQGISLPPLISITFTLLHVFDCFLMPFHSSQRSEIHSWVVLFQSCFPLFLCKIGKPFFYEANVDMLGSDPTFELVTFLGLLERCNDVKVSAEAMEEVLIYDVGAGCMAKSLEEEAHMALAAVEREYNRSR